MLSHIKDCHRNREGIADKINCHPHLEKILEKHPSIYLVHIIFLCQHGNQFITQDKCNNHACNRHNDRIGKILYQTENTSIPALRGLSDLRSDFSCLFIDIGKHGCQVGRDHPRQKLPHPFLDCFKNAIEHGWFSFPLCLKQSSQKRDKLCSD